MKRALSLLFGFAALVAFCLLLWALLMPPRDVVKLANGRVIRLEGYEFRATPVLYEVPHRPVKKWLKKSMPAFIANRIIYPAPTTVLCRPDFPGEPILSVACYGGVSGRWVISDGNGQVFDPGMNDNMMQALEIPAFPRRSNKLYLRLVEGDQPVATFEIPNPCRGPHPQWKAGPMPQTESNESLEVTLTEFTASAARARTTCTLAMGRKEQLSWLPVSLEISDATGNHWRPDIEAISPRPEHNDIKLSVYGALWSGEDAWKLRFLFRHVANFSQNDLIRLDHIPVPSRDQVYRPRTSHVIDGVELELSAIVGVDVGYSQIPDLNAQRGYDGATIVLTPRSPGFDRFFDVTEIVDDLGEKVELAARPMEVNELPGRRGEQRPFSVNVRVPAGAKELSIVLAVTRIASVDFLAKPCQLLRPPRTMEPTDPN